VVFCGCRTAGPRLESRVVPIGVQLDAAPLPLRLTSAGYHPRPPRAARLGIPRQLSRSRARLSSYDAQRVRLVVSLADRHLALVGGRDTLMRLPIAIANGLILSYAGEVWRFQTPRGERRVLRKVANPVWTPPDWHYAESALRHGLLLSRLPPGGVRLTRGRRLVVQNRVVGLVYDDQPRRVLPLPVDEHIVFDGRLFIPPLGTLNRRVAGELGAYALDLGHGYMIHGSSYESSLTEATTHGCIRVDNLDLVWLFENVPVGAAVMIR
jgi:lipoprotein-anchoring transpeptidase ErfK/SrfK